MSDPIIEEVRKHREEILQSYGSLRAYHNAMIEEQKQYGDRVVTLTPKRKITEVSMKRVET